MDLIIIFSLVFGSYSVFPFYIPLAYSHCHPILEHVLHIFFYSAIYVMHLKRVLQQF